MFCNLGPFTSLGNVKNTSGGALFSVKFLTVSQHVTFLKITVLRIYKEENGLKSQIVYITYSEPMWFTGTFLT